MKRIMILMLALMLLSGCGSAPAETTRPSAVPETTMPATTEATIPATTETTVPATTEATVPATTEATAPPTTEATVPATTTPAQTEHSALYIPWLPVEDVIRYFGEVCLDAEFVNSGNASVIQKWETAICYKLTGNPTAEDLAVLSGFADWLNQLPGFPGIREAATDEECNLSITFCTVEEIPTVMESQNFAGCDGAVTIWWSGANDIYKGKICYGTDVDQYTRNSVILEEIYNGLGPIQDTNLRQESIIYAGFSTPQSLHPVDELILKLLYSPEIKCGMNREACEAVIRQLYY